MTLFNQTIGYPLGWIMWALYALVKNYGLALFVFTLLIKAATFPLFLKQQKSTVKMSLIQPKIAEIQKRYKDNKEKINEETMALYQKEGYNPMAGCVPMLIPMILLFGMIDVIYNPLKHILHLPAEVIQKGVEALGSLSAAGGMVGVSGEQLALIRAVKADPGAFTVMGTEALQKIQELNLTFLWMDLTQMPAVSMFGEMFTNFNPVLLIPVISGLSALASSMQTMKNSVNQSGGAMKGMMYMMPLFSTWITFSVPAGVGLYWCFSNLIQIAQTAVMNKIHNPREIAEKARIENEERIERERLERIEAKKKLKAASAKDGADVNESGGDAEKALTAKEINRRKLAEARKRDAEKYGEIYVEVTDEDLQ